MIDHIKRQGHPEPIIPGQHRRQCRKCDSKMIIKAGIIRYKDPARLRQRYRCNNCGCTSKFITIERNIN